MGLVCVRMKVVLLLVSERMEVHSLSENECSHSHSFCVIHSAPAKGCGGGSG